MKSDYHKNLEARFLERLVDIKAFIRTYWEKEHHSPSLQEIAHEFKTSSRLVGTWLKRLEKDGWIELRKPGVARNIVPVEIFAGRDVFPERPISLGPMQVILDRDVPKGVIEIRRTAGRGGEKLKVEKP